jgi:predicted phage terminase large subunit-like protein
MTFTLTARQQETTRLLGSQAIHTLLYGGARAGKSFIATRSMAIRAIKRESRHAVLRFRFNHVKESMVFDTFPKVMKLCFPQIKYGLNKSDWFATFPNGSEIWFGGLDDKDRSDKILGKEYATMLFEEVSQISFSSVETALSRLAQKTDLPLRAYYTENPPGKGHWTYKQFKQLINPANQNPLPDPGNYQSIFLRPEDNEGNIAPEYIDMLRNMSGARRKRFYEGEFADENPNALWTIELLDRNRITDGIVPDFVRVVVAVDPSGAGDKDNEGNDAIGIVVMGLGTDGRAYLLEDLTVKAGPATWGAIVFSAYQRHGADAIVAETNFGGAMVEGVIKAAAQGKSFSYRAVTASRGKVVRAEPISALAADGKIRHVGYFPELEDELCAFSTIGYTGDASPNRADSYVWAVSQLFPQMIKGEIKPIGYDKSKFIHVPQTSGGWMAG